MSEKQYARKALEEVIRLADEKIVATEEIVLKKEDDFNEFAHSCDDTVKDLDQYFISIMRQLEKWKHVFIQELQASTSAAASEFQNRNAQIGELIGRLRELRETSAHILATEQFKNTDLVFDVHGCIFSINQAIENMTEFLAECVPLKFVGKLNFDSVQKSDVGSLERLADNNYAEILPSKLPKIKLGQLFNLDFRISKKYCEAAKRFITYSVSKEDGQYQKVCAYLHDNKDGSYALSFPITAIIPHTVHIYYLGEHIRNSPYTIVFKVGQNQGGNAVGVGGQTSVTGFVGSSKDIMGDGANNSTRPVGKTGDDYRRNKWSTSSTDSSQNNNNWNQVMGANISPESNQSSESGA
ncbi:Filamin ABP280 repeat [Echinococcus multilocularis]|uniref:Filamin ABP280 repeat n=1 Tax=Echinococcus multilocularis TaxID=6211 RepID=A0A068YD94_ECHMU|nr:Filamin ABP280 repeat [Echinococcus multilocularis]